MAKPDARLYFDFASRRLCRSAQASPQPKAAKAATTITTAMMLSIGIGGSRAVRQSTSCRPPLRLDLDQARAPPEAVARKESGTPHTLARCLGSGRAPQLSDPPQEPTAGLRPGNGQLRSDGLMHPAVSPAGFFYRRRQADRLQPSKSPGAAAGARQSETLDACYSWPYFRSTSRQLKLTRQLCAASVW